MPSSKLPIIAWDQAYNRNGNGKLPRAVVNVIRTYMDNDDLTGWVSQETLMADTGLSESQVRRQIKANVDAGWLEVVKRGCVGKATDYRLTFPKPVTDDRLSAAIDEGNSGHIRPVLDLAPNRSRMTGNDRIPVTDDRYKPVIDDTPTSPATSPQEKLLIATEGTEAPNDGADGRGRAGPSLDEAASAPAAEQPADRPAEPATEEYRPVGLQPPTATGSRFDDPFASEPAWRAEVKARKERADRKLLHATAGGPPASPWD